MTEPDRNPVLCLASASPRRRELLRQIGIAHIVDPADVDETQLPGETAEQYVQRLARTKAQSRPDAALPVLGADTAVVVDDQVLGKPVDAADARRMLALLSGREHRVLSAVALATAARLDERLSISRVRFAPLSASAIDAYVASGEPFGKAGGYAIQGRAAAFIAHLQGSYSGVMGLPLYETASLLADAAIP